MKKTKIAFCLTTAIAISLNAQASVQPGWVGNFLIGVSGGYTDLYGTVRSNLTYQAPGFLVDFAQANILRDYSDSGLILGAFLGYQEIRHQWLVGGELSFDLQALGKELNYAFSDVSHLVGWSATTRYQRRNMIGISGRLGYAITPYFMPYLRLGGELSKDKLIATFVGNPDVFPNELVIGQRNWLHRFLLGIGAEIPLPYTCGATMRLEYDFHSKARTIQGQATLLDGVFSPTFISSMQPEMQSGKISFVWNFF